MTDREFTFLLRDAIHGNERALEEILALYMPMINGRSLISGKVDEDLKQLIMIRIAFNIRKFEM